MSLNISVINTETGDEVEMNWLRNAYGLEAWAEDNYRYATRDLPDDEKQPPRALWEVVNTWAYDKGVEVDRPRFLRVVRAYATVIQRLEETEGEGYFWFDVHGLAQFVIPHAAVLPQAPFLLGGRPIGVSRIVGAIFHEEKMGIPMRHFAHPVFQMGGAAHVTLAHYQAWFEGLEALAVLLQHPASVLYVSN